MLEMDNNKRIRLQAEKKIYIRFLNSPRPIKYSLMTSWLEILQTILSLLVQSHSKGKPISVPRAASVYCSSLCSWVCNKPLPFAIIYKRKPTPLSLSGCSTERYMSNQSTSVSWVYFPVSLLIKPDKNGKINCNSFRGWNDRQNQICTESRIWQ